MINIRACIGLEFKILQLSPYIFDMTYSKLSLLRVYCVISYTVYHTDILMSMVVCVLYIS